MAFYAPIYSDQMLRQPNSPTWFEAVNSEFYYEQQQISNLKTNYNRNLSTENMEFFHTDNSVCSVADFQMEQVQSTQFVPMHATNQTHFPNDFGQNILSPMAEPQYPIVGQAPCEGPRPWNFAQCYGFYGEPPCPMVNIIDMEDFM